MFVDKILTLNRVNNIKNTYKNKTITKAEVLQKIDGWNAYAMHANTYKLRKRLDEEIRKVFEIRK